MLLTQPGGGLTRRPVPGSAGFGSVSGSFGNGDASVSAPAVTPYTPGGQLVSDIGYVFGELMHLAGQNKPYSDRAFSDKIRDNSVWASSAKKITLSSSPNYETLTYPLAVPGLTSKQKESLLNNEGDGPWSEYFHTVVDYNCFR